MAKVQVKIRGADTVDELEALSNAALGEIDERLMRGVNYTMMFIKGHGEVEDRPYYICTITYVELSEQEKANFKGVEDPTRQMGGESRGSASRGH